MILLLDVAVTMIKTNYSIQLFFFLPSKDEQRVGNSFKRRGHTHALTHKDDTRNMYNTYL